MRIGGVEKIKRAGREQASIDLGANSTGIESLVITYGRYTEDELERMFRAGKFSEDQRGVIRDSYFRKKREGIKPSILEQVMARLELGNEIL